MYYFEKLIAKFALDDRGFVPTLPRLRQLGALFPDSRFIFQYKGFQTPDFPCFNIRKRLYLLPGIGKASITNVFREGALCNALLP